jgi:muconolactone delta-isomerase
MTDVVLAFDYIDDEIRWPEFDIRGRLRAGWVKVAAGVDRPLLNVVKIKKVYAFGGKLYVLYDAEDVQRYEKYLAQLPPLAVELDYEMYQDSLYDGDCTCKMWRFSINTLYEEERFLQKLLGAEVELAHFLPQDAQPVNFSIIPIDVMLYANHIKGIAVVENPQFKGSGEDVYKGKYVVLADSYGYALFRIKDDEELKKLVGLETSPRDTA